MRAPLLYSNPHFSFGYWGCIFHPPWLHDMFAQLEITLGLEFWVAFLFCCASFVHLYHITYTSCIYR